jgi:hypothetical protein
MNLHTLCERISLVSILPSLRCVEGCVRIKNRDQAEPKQGNLHISRFLRDVGRTSRARKNPSRGAWLTRSIPPTSRKKRDTPVLVPLDPSLFIRTSRRVESRSASPTSPRKKRGEIWATVWLFVGNHVG